MDQMYTRSSFLKLGGAVLGAAALPGVALGAPNRLTSSLFADATTLDHSIWWHRPSHADDWLVYDAELLTLAEGRGIARGTVHDTDGRLVASLVQEVLRRA